MEFHNTLSYLSGLKNRKGIAFYDFQGKKFLYILVLIIFLMQAPAQAGSCTNSSHAPRVSFSIFHLPLLCTTLSSLLPKLEPKVQSGQKLIVRADARTFSRGSPKPSRAKRTGNRNRAKSSVKSPLLQEENEKFAKCEKNTIELLTSSDENDNQLGQKALFKILMKEFPWIQKDGWSEYFKHKIGQLARHVQGKSEVVYFEFYEEFNREIVTKRGFFKDSEPKPRKKDREWRRGLSRKEKFLARQDDFEVSELEHPQGPTEDADLSDTPVTDALAAAVAHAIPPAASVPTAPNDPGPAASALADTLPAAVAVAAPPVRPSDLKETVGVEPASEASSAQDPAPVAAPSQAQQGMAPAGAPASSTSDAEWELVGSNAGNDAGQN